MKKFLIIILLFCIIIISILSLLFFLQSKDYKKNNYNDSTQNNVPFYETTNSNQQNSTNTQVTDTQATQTTSSAPDSRIAISSDSVGIMMVKNFKQNPTTKKDPYNKGHYYLAGYPSGSEIPAYTILYVESDKSFTITLNQEPLKDTRIAAQQKLAEILNLQRNSLCLLRYSVLVRAEVNEIYSGDNLGFSFCPSAIELP